MYSRHLQDIISLPPEVGHDSQVLRNTMRVYGGWFTVFLLLFCYLRKKCPRFYNIRSWVDGLKTDLATEQYGLFSWMWRLFLVSDTEILDECGMDALCFIRILEFGLRLSFFAMIHSFWLMPIYNMEENFKSLVVTDPIVEVSISHLPPGSKRFIATVVAAYIIFGFAMYSILDEFQWFIRFRHQFLSKSIPRNYTVYVQNIPEEYNSNASLLEFFQETLSQGVVLDVHYAVRAPDLKAKVEERQSVLANLEHAINIETITGVTPMHRPQLLAGECVRVIDDLFEQLRELNQAITIAIEEIERKNNHNYSGNHEAVNANDATEPLLQVTSNSVEVAANEAPAPANKSPTHTLESGDNQSHQNSLDPDTPSSQTYGTLSSQDDTELTNPRNHVANVELSPDEGTPYTSAFVSFKTLRATQSALQLLQDPLPFAMEVLEAPDPEDVYWYNVGSTHKKLQIGKLLSFALTAVLCLFWTIPMTTINSLSTIDGLKGEVKFVAYLIEVAPWCEPLFAQLAPLLIVAATEVLAVILKMLSTLEGPVSGAVVEASLFAKLAVFTIVQTFFISTISGTLLTEFSNIIAEPGRAVDLLARTLPSRSTFFIQITLVKTFLGMTIELLRVSPITLAFIRSMVGWNLTEKERNTTMFGFLRPLADPTEFLHARLLCYVVLDFMVFFVYSAIAPISNIFLAICFLIKTIGYRHQLIHNYPTRPDSGGKLWIKFIALLPFCMIVAQVTIIGSLALKKSAIGPAMMFPLLVATILFTCYIHQKHFHATHFLAAREALWADRNNFMEGRVMDYSFVRGKYVQPELRDKELFPENTTLERERALGIGYGTPENFDVGEGEMPPETRT